MKAKIARLASAGLASGSSTRQKICNELAPSTRAASSYSRGIVRKNWRSRKTPNELPASQCGTISGQ